MSFHFKAALAKRSAPDSVGLVPSVQKIGTTSSSAGSVQGDADVTITTLTPRYRVNADRQYLRRLDNPVQSRTLAPGGAEFTGPDAAGVYTAVTGGNVVATVVGNSGTTYSAQSFIESPSQTSAFLAWRAGTLAKHITDTVAALVAAAGAFNASKLAVFSTQDHATPSYVRNATLWCSGYNWTGVSPWNSADANKRAGTLVSPRSFIHAAHYPIAAGTDVRFVAADGTVHTRTVVTSSKVGSTDIQVANLDSDLPSTIAFYAVLPSTWRMNLPNCHFGIPTVMFDQEEKALIGGLGSSPAGHIVYGSSLYLTWTEPLITGDSGNPVFLLINGAPVLVTTHTTVGGGPDLSANVEDINAILAPTGHQLTIANLSGFALT